MLYKDIFMYLLMKDANLNEKLLQKATKQIGFAIKMHVLTMSK